MSDSLQPHGLYSMEFSRPEYWSGSPFPSPGDLPNPGIKPRSLTLQADSLPAEPCFTNQRFFILMSSKLWVLPTTGVLLGVSLRIPCLALSSGDFLLYLFPIGFIQVCSPFQCELICQKPIESLFGLGSGLCPGTIAGNVIFSPLACFCTLVKNQLTYPCGLICGFSVCLLVFSANTGLEYNSYFKKLLKSDVCAQSLQSRLTVCDPMNYSQSMEFSGQENWSGFATPSWRASENTINRVKKQLPRWERKFANRVSVWGYYENIKNSHNSTITIKPNNMIKKVVKYWIDISPKKTHKWSPSTWKDFQHH